MNKAAEMLEVRNVWENGGCDETWDSQGGDPAGHYSDDM